MDLAFRFDSPKRYRVSGRKVDEGPNNSKAHKPCIHRIDAIQVGHGSPRDEKWTSEIKFEGYRCIAVKPGREVRSFSRHEKVFKKRFPSVTTALASLYGDFVLDGELVAFDPKGRPSFQILPNNLSHALSVDLYCFDLLNRDGGTLVSVWINGAPSSPRTITKSHRRLVRQT